MIKKLSPLEQEMLSALISARAIFQAQGIDENHRICGEQYMAIQKAISEAQKETDNKKSGILPEYISANDELPPNGLEVIGYSKEWINLDLNPKGKRICFYGENLEGSGWESANRNGCSDGYDIDTKTIPTCWRELP